MTMAAENISLEIREAATTAELIGVSPWVLTHGRLAPLRASKRPWLRSLKNSATNDPAVIRTWIRQKAGCDWGFKITSDALIVLDLERPGKGSVAGGVRQIDWIEVEHGKRVPFGPVATTQSGGQHRYFLLPAAYRGTMRNSTAIFPGVDLRVKEGLVVIPPSAGRVWIESPEDSDVPELPIWFCA
jgi:hypothetical protein